MRGDDADQLIADRRRRFVPTLAIIEHPPYVVAISDKRIANFPQPFSDFRVGSLGEPVEFGNDVLAAFLQFALRRFAHRELRIAKLFDQCRHVGRFGTGGDGKKQYQQPN